MDLNFLGRGAAFNPKEGNTSACFREGSELFLIDCGESVFAKLMEQNLLQGITKINLMLTHTHSDHVGSLGTLAMYSFFNMKVPLNIIVNYDAAEKQKESIQNVLSVFGCTEPMTTFTEAQTLDNKYQSFSSMRFFQTEHVKEINSFGIGLITEKGLVYYSGDTSETKQIVDILNSGKQIDKIYVDVNTANYPGKVHLNIDELAQQIPQEQRNKIYCMHFNNDECTRRAQELGFNVVEVVGERRKETTQENNL